MACRSAYALAVVGAIVSAFGAMASSPEASPPRYKPIPDVPKVMAELAPGTLTWSDLGELAASLGAVEYGALMDRGEVHVVAGTLVGVCDLEGRVFNAGDVLPDGPVWNPVDDTVVLSTKRADEPWTFEATVPANGLMHIGLLARSNRRVGDDGTRDGPGCPSTAQVTCVSGYWACCYIQENGCPRAVCYRSSDPPPTACTSGGEGSSSCSISIP
ncbi:MAG: hypothetical protein GIKADHBN_00352 [Phycisphaerales bacterium]|nr:hypothetical protein [Phycisphaerales bacterium]